MPSIWRTQPSNPGFFLFTSFLVEMFDRKCLSQLMQSVLQAQMDGRVIVPTRDVRWHAAQSVFFFFNFICMRSQRLQRIAKQEANAHCTHICSVTGEKKWMGESHCLWLRKQDALLSSDVRLCSAWNHGMNLFIEKFQPV